jgi:hypothetical protein
MNALASGTWSKIELGDLRGIDFSETSLTDHNLWKLDLLHPGLNVVKVPPTMERAIGADWEWWIGSDQENWICLRIQAKRVHGRSYTGISYPGNGEDDYQYDQLIGSCDVFSGYYPLHVLYNGWPMGHFKAGTGWAEPAAWQACPNSKPPAECRHAHWIHYGCAVASSYSIKAVHESGVRRVRSAARHLSYALPWSYILGAPRISGEATYDTTLNQIQEAVDSVFRFRPSNEVPNMLRSAELLRIPAKDRRLRVLPDYVEVIRQRRNRAQQIELVDTPAATTIVMDLGADDRGGASSNNRSYESWMARKKQKGPPPSS